MMNLMDKAFFVSRQGHRYICSVVYSGKGDVYKLTRIDTDEPTDEVRITRETLNEKIAKGDLTQDGWAYGKRLICTSAYVEVKNVKRFLKK
jgi:hypothetical protein